MTSVRVRIVVEGDTEEYFVKNLLVPHLSPLGVHAIPMIVYKPGLKGGLTTYTRAKREILRHLEEEKLAYCTTMFDLFRLPNDFPGYAETGGFQRDARVHHIEDAMRQDIQISMGGKFDASRFIPYLQVHEFEALLFSDPAACARGLYKPELANGLRAVRDAFQTPEDINDGPTTAPSKRIIGIFPGYDKRLHGSLACLEIGLACLRKECPHFAQWVALLEALAQS